MSLEQQKKMLYSFNVLVQRLPIKYTTFSYRRSEFDDLAKLTACMKRDISGSCSTTSTSFRRSTT